jgi:hypothetical protein
MIHYAPAMALRAAVIVIISSLACAFLAGCTQRPSASTVANPLPSPTQLRLTGTELKTALLPLSDLPAGYAVDTQDSSDSGSSLLSGTPSPTPTPGDCRHAISAALSSPPGLTAGANQALYSTTGNASAFHQTRLSQGVYQFSSPTSAAGFLDSLKSIFARCPSVTSTASGITTVTNNATEPASPVAGHQALLLTQTGTLNRAPVKGMALYTLTGTDIYLVGAGSFGVPFPAQVSLPALTVKLISRVQGFV